MLVQFYLCIVFICMNICMDPTLVQVFGEVEEIYHVQHSKDDCVLLDRFSGGGFKLVLYV